MDPKTSGLQDNAVTQGHDFIQHAEEEQPQSTKKAFGLEGAVPTTQGTQGTQGTQQPQQHQGHSTMDKVKEALHMKK